MKRKWSLVLILLTLTVSSLHAGAVAGARGPGGKPESIVLDRSTPVHPYLQYGAQVEPDRKVQVIIQKTKRSIKSGEIERTAGGKLIEEFLLTPSLVLELPLRAVPKVAKAPGVRYISYNGPAIKSAIDLAELQTTYPFTVGATEVWETNTSTQGDGVVVAVLDTGLNDQHPAVGTAKRCYIVNVEATTCTDDHGHGTHVAGTIKGLDPHGRYVGIAPKAQVLSLKIANNQGQATEADLLRGLDWVFQNRSQGIRVVNLSLTAATPASYLTSPLAASVEQLWLNGIVVVAAAGNRGDASDATWYPPGNDPFIITVGASDENGTASISDDALAPFSSRGITQDGHYKPEIVAPGRRIVAPLASATSTLGQSLPDRIVDSQFIRLSGTSMAAPVVTGAVAILLQRYPTLTPDQVKWLLIQSARSYPGQTDAAGIVHIPAALSLAGSGLLNSANQGFTPNSGIDPTSSTVMWGEAYWDQAYWDQAYWDQAYWDQMYWDVGGEADGD